jgi:hypothetical protein
LGFTLIQTLHIKRDFINIFYIALFQIRIKCDRTTQTDYRTGQQSQWDTENINPLKPSFPSKGLGDGTLFKTAAMIFRACKQLLQGY